MMATTVTITWERVLAACVFSATTFALVVPFVIRRLSGWAALATKYSRPLEPGRRSRLGPWCLGVKLGRVDLSNIASFEAGPDGLWLRCATAPCWSWVLPQLCVPWGAVGWVGVRRDPFCPGVAAYEWSLGGVPLRFLQQPAHEWVIARQRRFGGSGATAEMPPAVVAMTATVPVEAVVMLEPAHETGSSNSHASARAGEELKELFASAEVPPEQRAAMAPAAAASAAVSVEVSATDSRGRPPRGSTRVCPLEGDADETTGSQCSQPVSEGMSMIDVAAGEVTK